MKLVTPEQMKKIDSSAIEEYGIPGIVLMENAASAVTAEAVSMLGGCSGADILVLAGTGSNGGDAFAAARQLCCKGANARVYLLGEKTVVKGDALTNLNILDKMGLRVFELQIDGNLSVDSGNLAVDNFHNAHLSDFAADLKKAQLIIDGIFGTGLSRPVEGFARLVTEAVNRSGKPILSIDIPSGIDSRDGSIKGICINASATVTFCLPKTGLMLHPGCEYTGRLTVADISIPSLILENKKINTEYIDTGIVTNFIPKRTQNSNKGDYGRVMLVTGSKGMTGSGCLASMAALRTGAGLVYTGVPQSLASIYSIKLTEPVILPLEDNGSGCLAAGSADQILEHVKRMNVAVLGPGLTASGDITEIIRRVVKESTVPLVLDADALNAAANDTTMLKSLSVQAVITPHPGEMSRLTGLGISNIQADRIGIARSFASEYNVIVVLKGSRTVVAIPDGRLYINSTGNSGMATAGTGDVLTGVIAGLIAQGADAADAAAAGVFLHGLAGDIAAEKLGTRGMIAGDLIDYLPLAISRVSG